MKKVTEKTEKKPLVIDFRKVATKDLEGKELVFDVSKSLGNHIYATTADLGMLEVAQTIYKSGKLDLTDENRENLKRVVSEPKFPFLAVVKKRLLEMLGG